MQQPEGTADLSISAGQACAMNNHDPTLSPAGPDVAFAYPMHLDVDAIQRFIPHRGVMLFARRVTVLAHDHYTGEAAWPDDSFVFNGHFPGQPIVPGVMVIEAAAQIAGVGVRAGDPRARAKIDGQVGLLMAVRKCLFRRPVPPGLKLHFALRTRQVAEGVINVVGEVHSDRGRVASLEFVFAQAPADQVLDG